jgi:hypothetical protein
MGVRSAAAARSIRWPSSATIPAAAVPSAPRLLGLHTDSIIFPFPSTASATQSSKSHAIDRAQFAHARSFRQCGESLLTADRFPNQAGGTERLSTADRPSRQKEEALTAGSPGGECRPGQTQDVVTARGGDVEWRHHASTGAAKPIISLRPSKLRSRQPMPSLRASILNRTHAVGRGPDDLQLSGQCIWH